MSRLSREKRDQQGAAQPAVLAAAPIDVLVGPAGASVGGVPVTPIPGEEIHQTVLDHLHRIALATGHPVHATVHDNRIGYVLALRIGTDGSSQFTAEPAPTAPPGVPGGVSRSVSEPGQVPYALPGSGEPGEAFGPEDSGRVSYAGESGQGSYAGEPGQVSPSREQGRLPGSGEPRDALRLGAAESGGASTPPAVPPTDAPAGPVVGSAEPADQPPRDKPTHLFRQTPEPPTFPLRALPDPEGQEPRDAVPTFRLRAVPEWVAEAAPGTVAPPTGQFGPPPVMDAPVTDVPPADAPPTDARPETAPRPTPTARPEPSSGPVSTSGPAPTSGAAPSSGLAPTSGPAPSSGPVSTSGPAPTSGAAPTSGPTPTARPEPSSGPVSTSGPAPTSGAAPTSGLAPTSGPAPSSGLAPASGPAPTPARKPILGFTAATPIDDPDPKPTPPRGFDAVAEAVLGDDPATAYDGGGAVFLTGPMARINEAVKAGRVTEAAQLAEQTVGEASRTLGPDHPEVLRLLELTAYIAYLAGDPTRAFGLSLDLAHTRHHARDTEAAYGNIQSAATAWRAVRDPEQGLRMGVDLIGLWTELTMEGGAAAEDIEQLESARTRMGRLAERARKLNS
ncbi:hypothetical protein ACWD3I_38950 [Streptomyces sp. NPDC002817]|uniref:tetratricopeptide repeat protein n=1 Tax=Streptomyces sp. NPDC088357 TaxID=3154655 RepID=UPI003449114D